MTYIPPSPAINPPSGSEKDGDLKIATVSGVTRIYIWVNNGWAQIYPTNGSSSVINPTSGTEKEGDIRIVSESGSKVAYIWLDSSWRQLYPATFA
jgi:hypothetical protein